MAVFAVNPVVNPSKVQDDIDHPVDSLKQIPDLPFPADVTNYTDNFVLFSSDRTGQFQRQIA